MNHGGEWMWQVIIRGWQTTSDGSFGLLESGESCSDSALMSWIGCFERQLTNRV